MREKRGGAPGSARACRRMRPRRRLVRGRRSAAKVCSFAGRGLEVPGGGAGNDTRGACATQICGFAGRVFGVPGGGRGGGARDKRRPVHGRAAGNDTREA